MVPSFFRRHFAGFTACVFGLLLLPWILGVPGNPTPVQEFAWSMGLVTIIGYLVMYQCARSSDGLKFFNRPSVRSRLDGWLFAASVVVFPILSGTLTFLLLGSG
ncbi:MULTISPECIES: hypothetical protein [Ochrobactrum]|uniref:Uncharacterized protein n=1 Tax=Ochrobactrum quorumnocens TaxID=271865 RepID=A0A5N1JL44_9HYPH|nr:MULTISPECIES: hypothetical protein [Brucella/Ochrobactrum group]KAA9356147.1 hypothetical protein F3W84_21830 [[Ochrobactrum] quorumnocens]MBD7993243.1 hypothetical protein [Ochrobactrum gallinarum]